MILTPKSLPQVESLLRTISVECGLTFERPTRALGWLSSDKVTMQLNFGFSTEHQCLALNFGREAGDYLDFIRLFMRVNSHFM